VALAAIIGAHVPAGQGAVCLSFLAASRREKARSSNKQQTSRAASEKLGS